MKKTCKQQSNSKENTPVMHRFTLGAARGGRAKANSTLIQSRNIIVLMNRLKLKRSRLSRNHINESFNFLFLSHRIAPLIMEPTARKRNQDVRFTRIAEREQSRVRAM